MSLLSLSRYRTGPALRSVIRSPTPKAVSVLVDDSAGHARDVLFETLALPGNGTEMNDHFSSTCSVSPFKSQMSSNRPSPLFSA